MFYRKIITTEDGSATIYIPEWNESYHSRHGAIQEAYHVFLKNGLYLTGKNKISILEIGLGTGLNCLITLLEAIKSNIQVSYTGVEKYPVSQEEFSFLNYPKSLKEFNPELNFIEEEIDQYYMDLINTGWEEENPLTSNFKLRKIKADFLDCDYPENNFDLIYFDAFGARVQPELWTEVLFEKLYKSLKHRGILTTYSSKGSVRRALIEVGFKVEKKPGPPGKREMLIAIK